MGKNILERNLHDIVEQSLNQLVITKEKVPIAVIMNGPTFKKFWDESFRNFIGQKPPVPDVVPGKPLAGYKGLQIMVDNSVRNGELRFLFTVEEKKDGQI